MDEKEIGFKIKAIGKEMLSLIDEITEKFKEEYGFEPKITDITNLIARRAKENKLF